MSKENKEKINDYIDVEKIVLNIMNNDFKNLKNIEMFGYDAPDYFEPAISEVLKSTDLSEIVDQLGKLFDKLAKDQQFDLALVVQNFLQRYTYFLATRNDYNKHAENINASILDGHNSADIFQAVYMPFFSDQIDFYVSDFIDKLNQFDVIKWNEDYYNKVLNELEDMVNEKDFVKKLQLVEKFIMEHSDPTKLYDEIKINVGSDDASDAEKEAFATAFNEFKIILQSTDNLIEQVILELKKVVDEQ